MAKTRVHDLAKEYGMTSKEMLDHLRDMKIPAKSASSTLEDAYVSIVRKEIAWARVDMRKLRYGDE